MSVRAIAVRSGPRPAPASAPVRIRRRVGTGIRPRFSDDRRFIGVKLILIGLLFLAVMALEVPL